jgi:uncharacterized protein
LILPDVNILVYAHRPESPDHAAYREWLEAEVSREAAFGMADVVLSGFIRIVTHPRIFREPTATTTALRIVKGLRVRANCVIVRPGARHWDIFVRLCRETEARGNLVPDAYLAALAIEAGFEWITTDRDFARFAGLRWRHPLR